MFASHGTEDRVSIMDNVESLVVDIAAVELVLKGKFNDKIEELKKQRAEFDKALGAVHSVEQANKLLEEAKQKHNAAMAYDADLKVREELVRAESSRNADASVVFAKQKAELDAKEALVNRKLEKLEDERKRHDEYVEKQKEAIQVETQKVAADRAALEVEKEKFNEKLKLLRV